MLHSLHFSFLFSPGETNASSCVVFLELINNQVIAISNLISLGMGGPGVTQFLPPAGMFILNDIRCYDIHKSVGVASALNPKSVI